MSVNEHQYSIRDRAEFERGDSSVRLQNRPCGRTSGNVCKLSTELTESVCSARFQRSPMAGGAFKLRDQ